jgi:hypothetical protein
MKSVVASYRLMVHLMVALEPFDTRPSQYQVGQYRALLLRLLKAFILIRLGAASHHARRASTGHSTEPRTMAIGAPQCLSLRPLLAHQQFSSSS